MRGLGRPGWLFLHERVEHVCIWPPGSAGAWAGRGNAGGCKLALFHCAWSLACDKMIMFLRAAFDD